MTNNDFKTLLDQAVKPLQKGLDEVKTDLNQVKKDVKGIKEDLKEVKDIQENRVLPPLTYIETTVKSYADRYVTNEDHIRRLDKRLVAVEGNLEIYPPDNLSIPQLE